MKTYKFVHFGTHQKSGIAKNQNAGDTLLLEATRKAFEHFLGPIEWKLENAWELVDTQKVEELNKNIDAAIVGGGGMLLRDQQGASVEHSGWQWNIPVDALSRFQIPLFVFAIGYNRFRDQQDFDPIFQNHITETVRKSSFFGLRNWGSIRKVREYLPDELRKKVCFQPCPTTVLWQLYPELSKNAESVEGRRNLVVNVAFDRRELRFGDSENDILGAIAKVVRKQEQSGWHITVANHKPQDAEFQQWLDREEVRYEAVDLSLARAEEIAAFYAHKDLILGMRGHAQMIPFGLRKNIVSIVSHDKLQWFLEDIQHPEWGVDVTDPFFKEKLEHLVQEVGSNRFEQIHEEVRKAQEFLWQVTNENFARIKSVVL